MAEKRKYYAVKERTVQPKIYNLIFLIDNVYKFHSCLKYSLEDAVSNAKLWFPKADLNKLWHFTTYDFSRIMEDYKRM